MYDFPDDLWLPQRRGIELTMNAVLADKDVCLYGPTGSGKTRQAIELCKWCESLGQTACFYVNRKLLINQTAARFAGAGLEFGIRAAEYEDQYRPDAPFQIASAQSEWSRVYQHTTTWGWDLHPSNIVIVDEAHIQKGTMMRRILKDHRAKGAKVVLLTATPVGLSSEADELVVSGSMQEFRECHAIVPAIVKGISQPDMSRVQRNQTGEYIMDGKIRKEFTQTIIGDVFNSWQLYNPDARPTMAYWPGKPESAWGTEQFAKRGVMWAHVDATDALVPEHVITDGVSGIKLVRAPLTRKLWLEILERYRTGDIVGLSSRFKLREGIDCPWTWHCILATPIGSLASYLQTVGRIIRYSEETPTDVLVTDHGGNFWRHGSPNGDRPWEEWWKMPEGMVSAAFQKSIVEGKTLEPMRCPVCKGEFLRTTTDHKCPLCGHAFLKSVREVVMEDGAIRTREGPLVKRRHTSERADTQREWKDMYYAYKRKILRGGMKPKSFSQMYAWFFHEHHYWPPRDLDFMPRNDVDWAAKVHELPMDSLIGTHEEQKLIFKEIPDAEHE